MEDCQIVRYVNQSLLSWLGRLETEMKKRDGTINEAILQLESLQVADRIKVTKDEKDMSGTIVRFNKLITEYVSYPHRVCWH